VLLTLSDLTCTINQVSIIGCKKERDSQNVCKLRRGHNASMWVNQFVLKINVHWCLNCNSAVDLTPDFDGQNVTMGIYTTRPTEILWPKMDTNACNHMTCPVVKDQLNQYTYTVNVDPAYPRVRTPNIFINYQSIIFRSRDILGLIFSSIPHDTWWRRKVLLLDQNQHCSVESSRGFVFQKQTHKNRTSIKQTRSLNFQTRVAI
jgi:hypothetical protein